MVTITSDELDEILKKQNREIRFTVLGNPVSANRVTRRVGNKSLKSKEAREYQARVSRACFGTMLLEKQAYFTGNIVVTIKAINVRLDVDNISKTVLDGMQKIVYLNDRCVTEIHVTKQKDNGNKAQRLDVHVCSKDG